VSIMACRKEELGSRFVNSSGWSCVPPHLNLHHEVRDGGSRSAAVFLNHVLIMGQRKGARYALVQPQSEVASAADLQHDDANRVGMKVPPLLGSPSGAGGSHSCRSP